MGPVVVIQYEGESTYDEDPQGDDVDNVVDDDSDDDDYADDVDDVVDDNDNDDYADDVDDDNWTRCELYYLVAGQSIHEGGLNYDEDGFMFLMTMLLKMMMITGLM